MRSSILSSGLAFSYEVGMARAPTFAFSPDVPPLLPLAGVRCFLVGDSSSPSPSPSPSPLALSVAVFRPRLRGVVVAFPFALVFPREMKGLDRLFTKEKSEDRVQWRQSTLSETD
ncbi:hypothetical protein I7I48_08299 [Histoplasma ohiense]|nr:hypothetical protein I7I48_08299 [Histoplasma ohiense (nom. inval.)]